MDRHMGICHPRLEVTIRSSICVASRWSFTSHDLVLTDEGIRSSSLRGTFSERVTWVECPIDIFTFQRANAKKFQGDSKWEKYKA